MNHIAIMKKSLKLKDKIASGEKTAESRWYSHRRTPWGIISAGDTVYFKNSGEPITLAAEAHHIMQFENLTPQKAKNIFRKYGAQLGLSGKKGKEFKKSVQNKKYCILIFLKNPKQIKAFGIDKRGFGSMAAWMTLPNIRAIKKRPM